MSDPGQEASGEDRAEGTMDVLDSIEDLEPPEAALYDLKAGKYYRQGRC
jgi:hypothetical protein